MDTDLLKDKINSVPPRMNRLNDRFVKFLFGTERNKALLMDFINDALLLEGEKLITWIEFNAGELVQGSYNAKMSRIDISAQMSNGHTVDVEVQIVNYHDFAKRFPYYWAMRHVRQMKVGMSYLEIKPTILICILAFNVIEDDGYRNVYGIINDTTGSQLTDDMTIVFLELPKFRDSIKDVKGRKPNGLERWLSYFSEEEARKLSQIAQVDPMIFTAMMMEREFWSNEAEREQYFIAQKHMMDAVSAEKSTQIYAMQKGIEKGIEQGIEQGIQQGKAEGLKEGEIKGKIETARNMLNMGMSLDIISKVTGLHVDEIKLLASNS